MRENDLVIDHEILVVAACRQRFEDLFQLTGMDQRLKRLGFVFHLP